MLIFCFLAYLMIPLTYSTKTIDPLLTIRFLILIFNLCLAYLFLLLYLKRLNLHVLKNFLTFLSPSLEPRVSQPEELQVTHTPKMKF